MSKVREATITCPDCNLAFPFAVWESCNVTLDPSMKSKVLSGSLFKATCPTCGEARHIEHACLYHDMDKRFMVYKMPGHPQGEMRGGDTDALSKGYTLRLETDHNSFVERIRMLDEGLYDPLMEFVRLLGHQHTPNGELLYYIGTETDEFLFELIQDDRATGKLLRSGKAFYHRMLERFKSLNLEAEMAPGTFIKMDVRWLDERRAFDRFMDLLKD